MDLIKMIATEDIKSIRNKLITVLQLDLSGESGDVQNLLKVLEENSFDFNLLWESQNDEIFDDTVSEEYLNQQIVELSYNFSEERFSRCQSLGRKLFSMKKVTENQNTEEDNVREPSKTGSLKIKYIGISGILFLIGLILFLTQKENLDQQNGEQLSTQDVNSGKHIQEQNITKEYFEKK